MSEENKQKSSIWGGRFKGGPSDLMQEINASITFDKALYAEDIQGSKAHAQMLEKQHIISPDDLKAIQQGLDKIHKEIVVRNSKKGESFTALDDKKYTLQKDMCVIADKSGVLGLGGVIGGTRSGTELETKNILLESAYFLPSSIRKTSKLLSIETDAKYRFERGIDPNSMTDGLKIATDLILKICGGEASKFNISGKKEYKNKSIELEIGKFKKTVGFSITESEIKKILHSLGFLTKSGKKNLKSYLYLYLYTHVCCCLRFSHSAEVHSLLSILVFSASSRLLIQIKQPRITHARTKQANQSCRLLT